MKSACVIGWPITHSRSPLIHGFWLRHYGIDGTYAKIAVPAEDLDAFLGSMRERGLAGCNVTVPHKERAFAFAELRDPSALAVGAANTLWLEDDRLAAANTDTYGFIENLDRSAPGWRKLNGVVLVLGAGGAARAIIYGLLQAGRDDIRVFNRTPERARELAAHFGPTVTALPWAALADQVGHAALIVNTTTVGMNGVGSLGIDFAHARPDAIAADLVYVPLETKFLKTARQRGLIAVGGLGMLLHQAVPGFEKWFGVRPEVTRELYDLIANDIGSA